MASPQTENGFTKIANELLEAIYKTRMSDYEHRVFMLIIRKTYGFSKKEDWISLSQIAAETSIRLSHTCRTINKLLARNMIKKENKLASVQKDYEQWVTQIGNLPKQVTLPKQVIGVTQTGNKKLPKQGDTKDNKDTSTKEIRISSPKFLPDSMPMLLAENLKNLILQNKSDYIFKGEDFLEKWAYGFEKMIRLDKRDPTRIKEVMRWALKNSFWRSNILSAAKLREKFDSLELKMQQKPPISRAFESLRELANEGGDRLHESQ